MKTVGQISALFSVMCCLAVNPAHANFITIAGTLSKQTGPTAFDSWNVKLQTTGSYSVDARAYEASQSSTTAAGYTPPI